MSKTILNLVSVQYGLFFNNILSRPDLLTQLIERDYAEIFDGPPINLPVPPDIVEFPSSQLKSTDGKWQVSVSRVRFDIIFQPEIGQLYTDIDEKVQMITELILKVADEARKQSVEIQRVTNISQFFYKKTNNIETYLRDKFLVDKRRNFQELLIRFNEPITVSSIKYNNVTQYQTIKATDEKQEAGINVIRDFNTDPLAKDVFNNTEIKNFLVAAKEESHEINMET